MESGTAKHRMMVDAGQTSIERVGAYQLLVLSRSPAFSGPPHCRIHPEDRQVRELSFGARIAFAKESVTASPRLSPDRCILLCLNEGVSGFNAQALRSGLCLGNARSRDCRSRHSASCGLAARLITIRLNGHGPTLCSLASVVNDPLRTFARQMFERCMDDDFSRVLWSSLTGACTNNVARFS